MIGLGLCDNSDNAIIAIRKLLSCYRYWLHYLLIIVNNYIVQYISALGDVQLNFPYLNGGQEAISYTNS